MTRKTPAEVTEERKELEEKISTFMNGNVLKLSKPAKDGQEELVELTFREPNGADLRLIKEGNASELLNVAARLCARTPRFMDNLPLKDVKRALDYVGFLFMD